MKTRIGNDEIFFARIVNDQTKEISEREKEGRKVFKDFFTFRIPHIFESGKIKTKEGVITFLMTRGLSREEADDFFSNIIDKRFSFDKTLDDAYIKEIVKNGKTTYKMLYQPLSDY